MPILSSVTIEPKPSLSVNRKAGDKLSSESVMASFTDAYMRHSALMS